LYLYCGDMWILDSLIKPSKADSANELPHVPLVQTENTLNEDLIEENEAEVTKRVLRESQIVYWMAEIKAREQTKVQELPLFYRFALKLRDFTEARRLDDELRNQLSVILAQEEEEDERSLARLDPEVLEREEMERREREILRQEQEQAYLEALAVDQEKEAARRAQELRDREEQERLMNLKRPCILSEPPIGTFNVVNLVIRLPSGNRVQRRFHKDDKIQDLRDFVEYSRIDFTHPTPAELFPSKFTMIVLGAPPQPLTDASLTLEEARLYPCSALISIKVED